MGETVMTPELGLVCITTSDAVRFRTITRKRLLSLPTDEQQKVLQALYIENLQRLEAAIAFCQSQNIHLYRLPSKVFPFADEPLGAAILDNLAEELRRVGTQAIDLGIRLVLHPDQFVVLNSERPEVVTNSIKILKMHAHIFDLLGLPRSPWALMNIHGGKGQRSTELIETIRSLPDAIRSRLTLENDEYTYSATEIARICQAAGIAMVFDAHHHVIHEQVDSYDHPSIAEALAAARTTWQTPADLLVHISNGNQSFRDPQHSDYITLMPSAYREVPWIEVEAKQKEKAIALLREQWLLVQPLALPGSHALEALPPAP